MTGRCRVCGELQGSPERLFQEGGITRPQWPEPDLCPRCVNPTAKFEDVERPPGKIPPAADAHTPRPPHPGVSPERAEAPGLKIQGLGPTQATVLGAVALDQKG